MVKRISTYPMLTLGAGILILLKPKLLGYIVALYFISEGAKELLAQ